MDAGAGGPGSGDAGGDEEEAGEAVAVLELTAGGRLAPGQRPGEGAASDKALLFRAGRAGLEKLEAALAAAEAAAASGV